MSRVNDVSVVIRASGERTTELCYSIVCEEVAAESIFVIKEVPFRRAAERSFEIGIECGKPWTLCLDADILLREGAIQTLCQWAIGSPEHVLYVQGSILDKLFGRPRRAGPYLHRTSLLPRLLEYMPAEGMSLRPDTDAAMRLEGLGYGRLHHRLIIGLHEFEQYFRDIYRKAFVHAHKHAEQASRFEAFWERMVAMDRDYQVALWGLRDGRSFRGTVAHDVRGFPRDLHLRLEAHGLQEKQPLSSKEMTPWDVDQLMLEYGRMRAVAEWQIR